MINYYFMLSSQYVSNFCFSFLFKSHIFQCTHLWGGWYTFYKLVDITPGTAEVLFALLLCSLCRVQIVGCIAALLLVGISHIVQITGLCVNIKQVKCLSSILFSACLRYSIFSPQCFNNIPSRIFSADLFLCWWLREYFFHLMIFIVKMEV